MGFRNISRKLRAGTQFYKARMSLYIPVQCYKEKQKHVPGVDCTNT